MKYIPMISGELAPYQYNGGLGIAVENLSQQLVALGIPTEVFFPFMGEKRNFLFQGNQGLIASAVNVPFDMMNQPDRELAPNLADFCQKALDSIIKRQVKYFVAHDNEAAVGVVIGRKLGLLPIFWLHSLYDHPVKSDFPDSIQKLFKSESLLASAIYDSNLLVTSSGVLHDAISIEWPERLREVQKAIRDASKSKKIVIAESLGLIEDRCIPLTAENVASVYGLKNGQFVLFPSRPVLSKGIGFFGELAKNMRDNGLTFVAVGSPTEGVKELCKDVFWIPWLNKEELFSLMSSAFAVIHPSLTEGYGLAAAESTKFNHNVFCHPVGGLRILVECNLAHAVKTSRDESTKLYELWSDFLSAKSPKEAVAVWQRKSDNFGGLISAWTKKLFDGLIEKNNHSEQNQRQEGKKWQHTSWGEALTKAIKIH